MNENSQSDECACCWSSVDRLSLCELLQVKQKRENDTFLSTFFLSPASDRRHNRKNNMKFNQKFEKSFKQALQHSPHEQLIFNRIHTHLLSRFCYFMFRHQDKRIVYEELQNEECWEEVAEWTREIQREFCRTLQNNRRTFFFINSRLLFFSSSLAPFRHIDFVVLSPRLNRLFNIPSPNRRWVSACNNQTRTKTRVQTTHWHIRHISLFSVFFDFHFIEYQISFEIKKRLALTFAVVCMQFLLICRGFGLGCRLNFPQFQFLDCADSPLRWVALSSNGQQASDEWFVVQG